MDDYRSPDNGSDYFHPGDNRYCNKRKFKIGGGGREKGDKELKQGNQAGQQSWNEEDRKEHNGNATKVLLAVAKMGTNACITAVALSRLT